MMLGTHPHIARGGRPAAICLALAVLFVPAAGCGGSGDDASTSPHRAATPGVQGEAGSRLPRADEPVTLDPADFTTRIDNPYWPMIPGSRWVYREGAGPDAPKVTIRVLRRTRVVDGVRARVIHDVATRNGEVVEDTFDWFAQDRAGNIWYLGEDTTEFKDGKPTTTAGSWEAGVDGAMAGVVMPAKPRVGLRYRQEYYKGEAEDRARVLRLGARVTVPFGRFDHVLETFDYTPLQPRAREHKYYAKGVGPLLSIGASGRGAGEALITYRKGSG